MDMRRQKLLLLAIGCWLLALGAKAQQVKVEFVAPGIVHVVKGQPTKSLVVLDKPQANVQCSMVNGRAPS